MNRRIARLFTILLIGILFSCQPAQADIGLLMLIVIWPASWALFIPIVLLEAYVALRILKVRYGKGLKISALANLVSTLVGIPLTWILLVIGQMLIPCGSGGHANDWWMHTDTLLGDLFGVTIRSPWLLPPYPMPHWMIPGATISLCIPFFFMSVWVEYFIVAKVFGRDFNDTKSILRWSWMANLCSYGLIILLLVALLIYGIVAYPSASNSY